MDSLLKAIADAPDDDAPRLVWADREGGDRGELVVLQCMLARRQGERADRVRMQARVRELLPRFASKTETYERGFVEAIHVKLDELTGELFERSPGLRTLSLADFTYMIRPEAYGGATLEEAWDESAMDLTAAFAHVPEGRLRGLTCTVEIHEHGDYMYPDWEHPIGDRFVKWVAGTPVLAGLTSLVVSGLSEAAIPHLARAKIESLRASVTMRGAGCAAVVRDVPTLQRFAPMFGDPPIIGEALAALLAARATRQLRELDLWGNALGDPDLQRIAETPFTRLDTLGVGLHKTSESTMAWLPASRRLDNLVQLDAHGTIEQARSCRPFLRPPFALQRLRLGEVDDELVAALVRAPALEKLVVQNPTPEQLARLRATIPFVNDGHFR